jgi:hypothetical protein
MEQRIFHGEITPQTLATALVARFNRGNLQAQQVGSGDHIAVQVATHRVARSGGNTALTIELQRTTDGVSVLIGRQAWMGVAASLGATALAALKNPFSLLGRLDDLAQDIESLQLSDQAWQTIEATARSTSASYQLSERLRRLVCAYCDTANPVGEPACIACGAPLGLVQPTTCPACGFVVRQNESTCPNCKRPLIKMI